MFAIYKRELKSYFTSVIGCLFIAVTTIISGIFFTLYNLNYGYAQVTYAISPCLLVFVFTVPILTMKLIADDRRQKTDQLLLTSPVSVGRLVIGKYLAAATVFVIPILVMCLYPVIMSLMGTVAFKTEYTAILGLMLYGLVFVAVGLFVSSVTESQVISAILSIVILFAGYIMENICTLISSEGNIITKILGCFDLYAPLKNYMSGVIRLGDVVYYISIVVLFLFLTCQSIQKRRWNVSKKTLGTGVFSVAFIAIAVALTVFVNLIASNVSSNYTWATMDMTAAQLYTITNDTEKMLDKLNVDIDIYVLAAKSNSDETINKTLNNYKALSDHINVEYKDTTTNPSFYSSYTDTAPTANSLIVSNPKNNKSKVISYNDIYVADYSSYYTTGQVSYTGYDCEGLLDSAIAYVQSDETYTVYQIEGHDEIMDDSNSFGTSEALTDVIEKYNCQIEKINLMTVDEISTEDCAAIFIAGPKKDYSKDDAKKVTDYLNKGGKAIIALENSYSAGVDKPNLNSILEAFNINVQKGIVCENDTSYYTNVPVYTLQNGIAGFAADLSSYVFTPYTSGITQIKKGDANVTYTALATTSESAVLKTDIENATTYEKEDSDIAGPFDTVVSCSKAITTDDSDDAEESSLTAEILVFGSVYSLSDNFDAAVSNSNTQIVNNALKEYIDTDVQTVSVPAKSISSEQLTVTQSNVFLYGIVFAITIPIIVLIAGIVVWFVRRKK